MVGLFENLQTRLFRGRRSRNKVSVGEPAEGSLSTIGWVKILLLFTSRKILNSYDNLALRVIGMQNNQIPYTLISTANVESFGYCNDEERG